MIFRETGLPGAFVIELEPVEDERGWFARTWCEAEARAHGIEPRVVQCNASFNRRRGTLRGLHWQVPPHAEAKLIRCIRGAIFDVVVDLRPGSPTFGRHAAAVLSAEGRTMIYAPEGFAHGFQTLEDATEVVYHMSAAHHPASARGVVWDDPTLAIAWPPAEPRIISERDRRLPRLAQALEMDGG